ncbi:MAG TPA: tetratricopeptide repeat protein, partial [Pyrinomonadaceae bacterium]|nr:tetratricopeptide repeat protein [Pyrinomonadaceae bacterium]
MAEDTPKIHKSLQDALKAKQVVPFIGAGVSMSVKKKNEDGTISNESLFPSWKGFVEILAETLKDENKESEAEYILSSVRLKKPKYLEALQHAQEELGESLWYKLFDESFDKTKDEAHEDSLKLNELIWQLSNNLIITTNVDRVLQWTCPQSKDVKPLDVQNVAYAQLQKESYPKRPTVWYLHGSIDHVENVIFTRQQFEDFYKNKNNEAKFQTLLNLITQKTFLFIGFSLDDDYLREVLEYIHKIYKGGADSYYILFREKDIAAANFPKYVTPVPFSDFGKPLEDLIEKLIEIANEDSDSKKKEVVEIIDKTPPSHPKVEKQPYFNVPFASKDDGFIGRKDKLKEIHESLKSGKATHIGQARNIQGMGGLGKTQLAVEYAHRFRDEYPQGIYWITADADINNQLITIGEAERWIFRDDKSVNQFEVAREQFLNLEDCLIIFDNAESVDDIKSFIPKNKNTVHLLITSRNKQEGVNQIDLDILSEDDSKELLLFIVEKEPQGAEEIRALDELIKQLDGLPLAIELIGGYLFEYKDVTFREYLNFFNNEPLENLEIYFSHKDFVNDHHSLIKTLKISEKLFNKFEYLKDILDVLAWSGSSSMSVSLLQEIIQPESLIKFKTALSHALQLKLLKRDEKNERYAIHRLLGRVRRLERPLEQHQEWHQKVLNGLITWFDERREEFNHLEEYEEMLEHLERWETQSLTTFKSETANLIWLKAYPVWHRGDYKNSQNYLEESLKFYENNSLNKQELQANIIGDLGVIYGDLGNHQKALEYQEKALELRKEIFGEKHPNTANSYNNV